jgi:hypothetical protein
LRYWLALPQAPIYRGGGLSLYRHRVAWKGSLASKGTPRKAENGIYMPSMASEASIEHYILWSSTSPRKTGYHACDKGSDAREDATLDTGRDNGTLRVTIKEAAHRLGETEAAIRKRIQRGSLDKEMGSDRRVYVYLDLSQDVSHPESQVHHEALIEDLREQVHYLRSLLNDERDARRRADMIIAQLTQANAALAQRIPELGAPPERSPDTPRGAAGAGPGEEESTPAQEGPQERAERPWWRRVFGS